jgi:phage replication O-like protein O
MREIMHILRSTSLCRYYYTVVPDDLFDDLLPELSGAELKVLLYIVRRTFGFKKDADTISLQQICKGITTKDGRRLDRGTGLSEPTVVTAIKGLVAKNIIAATRQRSAAKGDEPTIYSLVFSDDPVLENTRRGDKKF